ncbi:small secreted hydrophilic protein [Streptomyces youssoufiensis]
MALSHRLATLTAVVAIPLGIAVTSYLLTDSPDSPKAPSKVELESGTPAPDPSAPPDATPTGPPPASDRPAFPSHEAVPPPPATDGMADDTADDTTEHDDAGDDGPGGDG